MIVVIGYEDVVHHACKQFAVIVAYDGGVAILADGLGQIAVAFFPRLHFIACEQGKPADKMQAFLLEIGDGLMAILGGCPDVGTDIECADPVASGFKQVSRLRQVVCLGMQFRFDHAAAPCVGRRVPDSAKHFQVGCRGDFALVNRSLVGDGQADRVDFKTAWHTMTKAPCRPAMSACMASERRTCRMARKLISGYPDKQLCSQPGIYCAIPKYKFQQH